jgi:hypothetical protein
VVNIQRPLCAGRQAHAWPPALEPPEDWAEGFTALAADVAFPISRLEVAVRPVYLTQRLLILGPERMHRVCQALHAATGCRAASAAVDGSPSTAVE